MKKVFFFMALAVAGLAMTACGGNKEGENSLANDAKALAKAYDDVMKADNPEKTKAAAEVFGKTTKDFEKKYKDNKEFEEAFGKELKNLGYDPEKIIDELNAKMSGIPQPSIETGTIEMNNMGGRDESDDDMDMSNMDMDMDMDMD